MVADGRASESLEQTVYADASDAFSVPAEIIERLNLLAQDRCLPRSLPSDGGTGLVDCRVLLQVASGCGAQGLRPANMTDAASVARAADVSPGTVCELIQLPGGASCKSSISAGWCYVIGSCFSDAGRTCSQAICTSSGFDGQNVTYEQAWIACS
jgi:hypothetical protein